MQLLPKKLANGEKALYIKKTCSKVAYSVTKCNEVRCLLSGGARMSYFFPLQWKMKVLTKASSMIRQKNKSSNKNTKNFFNVEPRIFMLRSRLTLLGLKWNEQIRSYLCSVKWNDLTLPQLYKKRIETKSFHIRNIVFGSMLQGTFRNTQTDNHSSTKSPLSQIQHYKKAPLESCLFGDFGKWYFIRL